MPAWLPVAVVWAGVLLTGAVLSWKAGGMMRRLDDWAEDERRRLGLDD